MKHLYSLSGKNLPFQKAFFIVLFLLFSVSCSGKPAVKPSETFNPEKAFTNANEQLEKKEYEAARAAFLEVKTGIFPKNLRRWHR